VRNVPPGDHAANTATTAVVGVLLALSLAGVPIPAEAAPGFVGVSGALASISYLTGGHDPAPPPPLPADCQPDSTDPTCQPPPPPPHRRGPFFIC